MGKFANDLGDRVGMRLGPGPVIEDKSGFGAFGKTVPQHRKQAGQAACKEMGMTDPELIWDVVTRMANKIERDEPHMALEIAFEYLDVCGCYRLLAVLCTAEKT